MSLKNRKKFEDYVVDKLGKVTRGGGNATIYKRLFENMSDKDFNKFIEYLEAGNDLAIFTNDYLKGEALVYSHMLKLCKQIGVEVETQLRVKDQVTGLETLTPHKVIVGKVECRKQRQMLAVKFSYAKDDTKVDDLTGQPTGDSRATGLSYPELNTLRFLGLPTMANELYNVRAGDEEAFKAYRNDLMTTGKTNTNSSLRKGNIVKSLDLAHYLMRARHLDNNFNKRYG